MIVLDTNVVSELMRTSPAPALSRWLAGMTEEVLVTTVINVAEIEYGIARLPPGRRRDDLAYRFRALIGPEYGFQVLDFEAPSARLAGCLRFERERLGLGSTFADMTIAAITLAAGASLATRNVADFDGIGIEVLDPWTSQHA